MGDTVMFVPRNAKNHNEGLVYERKVMLFIAASLSQNEDVDDFSIVSNPIGVDKFDDVIVKVSFKDNRKNIAIFIQVKHTESENKSLWLNRERTKKQKLYNHCEINLEKYEKAFDEVMSIKLNDQPKQESKLRESKLLEDVDEEDYFMCIFTNIREVDPELHSKQFDRSHPIYFLDTSTYGEYRDYIFQSPNTNQTSQNKQFFIFLDQPNVFDIDYTIANLLGSNFINKLVNLDKTIKEYMQRGNDCAILTRRAFEFFWLKVLLEDWLLDNLGQVEEINPTFRDLWYQIFSIQEIVDLRDDKIWPLLACFYEYVVRKEIDINFNWRTGVTDSTTNIIKENYSENVTNIKELLTLLWRDNEIPLPIKPEHTQNILTFLEKFKTVGRRFVVFSGDDSGKLITDMRHISKIRTLEEAMKIKLSIQGRLPVALSTICEGVSLEKTETIRSAVDGIFNDLKLSQLLAWTKTITPGNENQHIIGPILPKPDNNYIKRNFILKQDEEQNELSEEAVLDSVRPGLHIITGEPGMGKSTVLQALAYGYSPRNFVIYIKLRDCLEDIENSATLKSIESDPIKYFFDKMTNNTNDKIAKSIMEMHRTSNRLCLFLDAFDEILPLHGRRMLLLMTTILDNSDVPIFCTMRPHAEEKITCRAGSICFNLLPFHYEQIEEYITNTNIQKNILCHLGFKFLSNPLHLHMISQIYVDHENHDYITRGEMYKRFIEFKHKTYNNKMNLNRNVAYLSIVKSMKQHRELALVEIFGKERVTSQGLTSDAGLAEILDDICCQNIGIVDVRNSNKSFQFVHRTFAEYLVADLLLNSIVQSVSNTRYLKEFYRAVWYEYIYRDIKIMIEERIRNYDLWFEARKYFLINSDNKKKRSKCKCDGFLGWLKCTVSHPNVNGSTIVDQINTDYPTSTQLTEDDGDTCIKLLTAIHAEIEEDVESNLSPPLLDTGIGIVAFNLAITTGNGSIVKLLLAVRPGLLNEQDVNGNTGLHITCAFGYSSIAALLFEQGANFGIQNETDKTPLGMATECKQWGIWKMKHIEEINKRLGEDRRASTENRFPADLSEALLIASRKYKWDIVEQFLEYGADPSTSDDNGWTPMHFAVREKEELEGIKMLLDRGLNVNEKTNDGKTPLTIACDEQNWDTVKWLLEHDADPTLPDDNGWTPMHFAAKVGQLEIVNILLDIGLNVNERTNDGETPLTISHDFEKWYSIVLLLKNGADPIMSNANGWALMHFAARKDKLHIIKLLWERGFNVNEKTNDGKTPLMIACDCRKPDIVKWLLEHGADPTLSDDNGWTSMHFAARSGQLKVIKLLSDRGFTINKRTNDGKTPLIIACDGAKSDIVKWLLEHGADPIPSDENGWTLMHFAARGALLEIIKLLSGRGLNINDKTNDGKTPLTIACDWRNWNIAKWLLEHSADPSLSDDNGWTSMHFAARGGQLEIMKLLSSKGLNINTTTNEGRTPLTIACDGAKSDIVKWLLDHGAGLIPSDENGWTLMHFAARGELIEIAKILLERGLNVNEKTNDGNTPLTIACDWRNWNTVKWLLDHGADPTLSDDNGWTSMHFAARGGQLEIMKLLSDRGLTINKKTNDGKTPLTISCNEAKSDIVKWLLEHGADPILSDENGWTLMHFATRVGQLEIAQTLLERGFNVNEKTKDGKTPLIIACVCRKPETVKWLLEHGADPTLSDDNGWTSMHFAAKGGQLETIKMLSNRGLNVHKKTKDGKTPLIIAGDGTKSDIVKWLLDHGSDGS